MKPDIKKEAERWLRQAEEDLSVAQLLTANNKHNVACFMAQQSAEKALKAFLYSRGAEEVWGHSVAELSFDSEKFDKSFEPLRKKVSSLDKYYIPTRYPGSLPGGIPAEAFDKDDAEKAIRLANQTISFVKKKLL
ncbi:HEPN domain-containing protein [Candidatus Micrarchaeota archaeon]|nr:HEPN domain-containing protein [Candidatus Micrarchaeota archaeon]MBU1166187.1 HEPN domain-containing protein [Candidatus Micrarchaeota archaeon]MBU1886585.1 HEPN domain-containing protein [Candidatus Micrarchaeota archaeon]